MIVSLHINRDGELCSENCVFLFASFVSRTGSCGLFRETLRPSLGYGDIDGWHACESCNKVCDKVKEHFKLEGEEQ